MPTCGTWTGFGFAISHNTTDQQIWIIESRTVGMQERIAELSTFVNGAGGFRRCVAGDPAGPGELRKQALHSLGILSNSRIKLGVGTFEVGMGDNAGSSMTRTGDKNDIEVLGLDQAIDVRIDEIQPRGGS